MDSVKFWAWLVGLMGFWAFLAVSLPILWIPWTMFAVWFGLVCIGGAIAAIAEWWDSRV